MSRFYDLRIFIPIPTIGALGEHIERHLCYGNNPGTTEHHILMVDELNIVDVLDRTLAL